MPNPYCQRRRGTYYLRLRIPADLRKVLGAQVMRSLRTSRAYEARSLAAAMVAAAPGWWAVLRAEAMATILGKPLDELTLQDLNRANLPRMQADLAAMDEADRVLLRQRLDAIIGGAEAFRDRLGSDYRTARLALEMMQHGQNVGLNKALALAGAGRPAVQDQAAAPLEADADSPVPRAAKGAVHPKARLTMEELSEEFFTSEGQGESSRLSYLAAFQHFARARGNKAIGRVTEDDLLAFRSYCEALPGRDGREKAARGTVEKHLSHVKSLLRWASTPPRRFIAENPGTHVMPPRKPKGATDDGVRLAFDEAHLIRIFRSPLFTGSKRGQWSKPGPFVVREDRFYFFLCMLLTGARNDELPEAGIHDLVDIPCLDLRATGTKTPAGPRVVPILPELRRTGFLAWARKRIADGGLLFRGPHAVVKWGDFPSRYLRDIGVGDRLHSAYSLRHSHRQMLRGAGLTQELIDKTFGHEANIGARYGRGSVTLQEARNWLGAVRAPISLEHLFVE